MNKIWGILLSGALLLSIGTSAYASTAVTLTDGGTKNIVQKTDTVQYNMSIHSYYGDSNGKKLVEGSWEQYFDYSYRTVNYTPPLLGEITGANYFWITNAEGKMAQDWNNQGTMREVGWGYGGAANLGLDTPVDWSNIIDIANNTDIMPGRTQAIMAGDVRLAYYTNVDKNGDSVIRIDEQAYEKFLNDNKTVTDMSEFLGMSTEVVFIDGEFVFMDVENWLERTETIYDLSVQKTVSPIVLDIVGSGKIEASNGQYLPHKSFDPKNVIVTDFWGDGFEVAMEWVGPNDGLLVAPKADGTVDMTCLFGIADGFDNGYDKLKLYADKDGIVQGWQLAKLSVWQDTNKNGIAEKGEVKTCTELGITSINTNHKGFVSSFEINGKTQKCWDWWPNAFELRTIANAK